MLSVVLLLDPPQTRLGSEELRPKISAPICLPSWRFALSVTSWLQHLPAVRCDSFATLRVPRTKASPVRGRRVLTEISVVLGSGLHAASLSMVIYDGRSSGGWVPCSPQLHLGSSEGSNLLCCSRCRGAAGDWPLSAATNAEALLNAVKPRNQTDVWCTRSGHVPTRPLLANRWVYRPQALSRPPFIARGNEIQVIGTGTYPEILVVGDPPGTIHDCLAVRLPVPARQWIPPE